MYRQWCGCSCHNMQYWNELVPYYDWFPMVLVVIQLVVVVLVSFPPLVAIQSMPSPLCLGKKHTFTWFAEINKNRDQI